MGSVLFSLLLALALALGPALAGAETGSSPPGSLAGKIVVLDPGHAVLNDAGVLINPGARARRGAYERDIALNIAEKIMPLLEAQGARVYLTRTRGNPWRHHPHRQGDNRSRAIFANILRADAYVRLHCDWNRDKRFRGITVFYFRWGSRALARSLHQALQVLRRHDHGIHRRTFVSVTAQMPAVLLELGVLSNKEEGRLMATELYQSRVAQAIADGITDYFDKIKIK